MHGLLVAILAVAGFGASVSESVRVDSPLADQYSCLGQPFPREALENQRGFEDQRGALAAALRRSIVKNFGPERDGWLVLARSKRTALFGQGRPVRVWLRFERRAGGRWKWAGSGGCDRRAFRDGTTASPWRVDPDQAPGADATEVRALVNELACNSGMDSRGRVQAPWVHYGSERVTVTYFVTPRSGGGRCPANPDTPVTLSLEEPLGERELCDGGTLPATSAEREDPIRPAPRCRPR